MSHFQGNTAFRVEPAFIPKNVAALMQVREPSSEFVMLVRLNDKLQKQCGDEYSVQCWSGDQLHRIQTSTLRSLARCYAEVFNESWGENWTEATAMAEVQKCLDAPPGYMPVVTMLFRGEDVVGFCWAFIMETDALTEESAPFSSSSIKRHESVNVARYWLDSVGRKNTLVSIRELGVIKEHRQDKTPFLLLPILEKAKAMDCNVAFFRTKTTSKAFKWGLGIGFVPLQLFMVDDLLLMKGNVKYAMNVLYGSLDEGKKRQSQHEIIGNIKRYLCD